MSDLALFEGFSALTTGDAIIIILLILVPCCARCTT
jgi:hypothetical protein